MIDRRLNAGRDSRRAGRSPEGLDPGETSDSHASLAGQGKTPAALSWEAADQRLWAVNEHGAGLAVAFWRRGDRYAHALYALLGSADPQSGPSSPAGVSPLLLMASQEGTDQESWPSSPPLQQLIVEPREAGREVALLIGMAGSSHWSLSIDVDRVAGLIVFETACRCSSRPVELGSRYWLHPPNRLSARHLDWHLSAESGVELLWPDSRGEWSEGVRADSHWTVRPAELPAGPWPATIRWNYAVRWLPRGSTS
jgi:hypothetical protein